jgi:hypothetical protein
VHSAKAKQQGNDMATDHADRAIRTTPPRAAFKAATTKPASAKAQPSIPLAKRSDAAD